MRASRAIAACAVSALAMVFSVQQGEYGPLVVYKLQVPKQAAPGTPVASPPSTPSVTVPPPAEDQTYMIPSRAPRVLGRVVMPASGAPAPAPRAPSVLDVVALPSEGPGPAAEPYEGVTLRVPDRAAVLRIVEDAPLGEPMFNEATGEVLTLKQVNDEISWRHDTIEKLRHLPAGPGS